MDVLVVADALLLWLSLLQLMSIKCVRGLGCCILSVFCMLTVLLLPDVAYHHVCGVVFLRAAASTRTLHRSRCRPNAYVKGIACRWKPVLL
jgi:hypothetical protein